MAPKYKFLFVPDFFIKYEEEAKKYQGGKIITQPQLGILTQDYGPVDEEPATFTNRPQWARFAEHVKNLNETCGDGVSYKLFYLIRHGIGVHNVVMEAVGSEAWRTKFSMLDGARPDEVNLKDTSLTHDGKLMWVDALLVEDGIAQAKELAETWMKVTKIDEMPLPQSIYTSPLARCLETTKLVYEPVMAQQNSELHPIVKEALRERLTNHTCDKRRSRSWIEKHYPNYIIEPGFTENDNLWKANEAPETEAQHIERKRSLLEDIFEHDDAQFISLTTHSYAISAILAVVGAPKFRVSESVLVPLFIKAKRIPPVDAIDIKSS
ncbi:hypothetical protein PFICI_06759 [Pestalotiopsis fici W106-1]|uniref:Phosphoglycerate mutase n=1 Tax=Pestalotiopsis fici (strain W106-1 / CGMCC3.15140) TaxID=1229662 RepID=W3X8P6_PESFW|nr:uncharacterized protein PFICI_06759 [Pestalotiopsis fici W106-1]ETS81757.1 hypothetical protein PFICI_06759 [Pestalotiopsis fici W106-1]